MNQLEQRYTRQIERLNGRLAHLRHRGEVISRWRLAVFLLGGMIAVTVFLKFGAWQWALTSAAIAVPFLVLVAVHRRVETAVNRHEKWRNIKQTHLARMQLDWDKLPPAEPIAPALADHPFALDLDLVGDHSLHRLMDTAVTVEGSERLRDWLLATAPPPKAVLAERQTAVSELRHLPRFRDKLQLQAALVADEDDDGEKWVGRQLLEWLDGQEPISSLKPALFALIPLSAVTIVLFFLNLAGKIPPYWVASWLLYAAISMAQIRKVGDMLKEAFFLQDGVAQMTAVFQFLEQYPYKTESALAGLCAVFVEGKRPSALLRQIRQVVSGASLQRNPIVWFWLNAAIPWDIFFAYKFNAAKLELGDRLPIWLDCWFELEALNGLATFAHLNPSVTWPTVSETSVSAFVAEAIGHPLIPAAERVCNDYTLTNLGNLDIITGSNMAGKSSFLRTLGINLAMAYAGGGVMASRLETRPFRLYTSMRLNDSVTSGYSFFYAEVRRLQALLAALEDDQQPLFFLIDEIFRGTNNRERFIGSQAYARALLGKNGVGLIATHDLELARLSEGEKSVTNYHFRDDVIDGQMEFDYKLHDGACPTTNALKIMELAGLPVSRGDEERGRREDL